jgi:hypothetical protein
MAPISIKSAKTAATTKPTTGSGPDSADTPVKQEKKNYKKINILVRIIFLVNNKNKISMISRLID